MFVLFGIVGTLLGVIIGAFLTRWVDFHYERRREVRRAISSALVLRSELDDARAGLKVIIQNKRIGGRFLFAGLDAWDEHREALLVAGMAHPTWLELAGIFRHLLEVVPMLKEPIDGLDSETVELLREVKEECEKGMALLQPFMVEGAVPFLRPESIFSGTSDVHHVTPV